MGMRLNVEAVLNVKHVAIVAQQYELPLPIIHDNHASMTWKELGPWLNFNPSQDVRYTNDTHGNLVWIGRLLHTALNNEVTKWMNSKNLVMSMEARTFEQIFEQEKLELIFS